MSKGPLLFLAALGTRGLRAQVMLTEVDKFTQRLPRGHMHVMSAGSSAACRAPRLVRRWCFWHWQLILSSPSRYLMETDRYHGSPASWMLVDMVATCHGSELPEQQAGTNMALIVSTRLLACLADIHQF